MITIKNNTANEIILLGKILFPSEVYNIESLEENKWLTNSEVIAKIIAGDLTLFSSAVSPRQLRIALFSSGILEADVQAAIDTLAEPDKTISQIGWEYANDFERNDALVEGVGALLGLTTEQMDDIWALAITI